MVESSVGESLLVSGVGVRLLTGTSLVVSPYEVSDDGALFVGVRPPSFLVDGVTEDKTDL